MKPNLTLHEGGRSGELEPRPAPINTSQPTRVHSHGGKVAHDSRLHAGQAPVVQPIIVAPIDNVTELKQPATVSPIRPGIDTSVRAYISYDNRDGIGLLRVRRGKRVGGLLGKLGKTFPARPVHPGSPTGFPYRNR